MNNQSLEKFSSASQLLKESLKIYKSRLGTLLAIVIIPVIFSLLVVFSEGFVPPYIYLLLLLIAYFFLVLIIPSIIYAIKENLGLKESYKKALKIFLSYIWVWILGGVITFGGYVFLIIPGIIFAIWFILAAYVLIFEEKRGMNALFRSK